MEVAKQSTGCMFLFFREVEMEMVNKLFLGGGGVDGAHRPNWRSLDKYSQAARHMWGAPDEGMGVGS